MERRSAHWKTNISQGAEAKTVALNDEMAALAIRSAHVAGLDYAGVDLMPAENGKTYVLEINSIPGWHGLQKTTDLKIAHCLVEYALESTGRLP